MALCHELIKAPRAYQSLTKRNKSQQSLSQCVGKLNRAWFKAGTPVFKVCHHLTRFVKMSQDLLRSGMKIWHEVRRFHHQTLTRFVTLWWRTLMLWEALLRLASFLTLSDTRPLSSFLLHNITYHSLHCFQTKKKCREPESVISSVTKPDRSGIKARGTVTSRVIICLRSGNQFVSERIRAYLSVTLLRRSWYFWKSNQKWRRFARRFKARHSPLVWTKH